MSQEQARSLRGEDRLIVALDVSTHERAFELADLLDNVSFFKVGLELFLAGNVLGFIRELWKRRAGQGGVFLDLKLSGDIGNTITRFVEGCAELNVRFITLVESVPFAITVDTIRTAVKARGEREHPKLLMVPLLSSLNADDLQETTGRKIDATEYIVERGERMLDRGCDGLIVSGDAIKACRERFPDADIVSPGIRPAGASVSDHKRSATPGEAIRLGADYLVVGRPVLNAESPRAAAQKIIDEIDAALEPQTPVTA